MKQVIWGVLAMLFCVPARADSDPAKGEKVFAKCMACHAIDAPRNKVGPHLVGIVDRPAASVADYTKYSDAMKKAGADGMVWSEANLAAYLASPKSVIPEGRMAFSGLKSEQDIVDIIAYLKEH